MYGVAGEIQLAIWRLVLANTLSLRCLELCSRDPEPAIPQLWRVDGYRGEQVPCEPLVLLPESQKRTVFGVVPPPDVGYEAGQECK